MFGASIPSGRADQLRVSPKFLFLLCLSLPLLSARPVNADELENATAYWIVNTRSAPHECYDPGQLRYQRVDKAGQVHCSTLAAFLAAVDPAKPVCFFAHGNLSDSDVAHSDAECARYGVRQAAGNDAVTFVLVSWPSQRMLPFTTLDLGLKAKRSDAAGYYLGWVVDQLPADQPVCLMGHSLGARCVAGALEVLGDGSVRGQGLAGGKPRVKRPTHAVLLAASIDHNWLNPGDRFGRALQAVDEILIFTNDDDPALALYPLRKPFSPSALGKVGLRHDDWCQIDSASEKISEVELADVLGRRHDVAAYFHASAVHAAMAPHVRVSRGQVAQGLAAQ